MADSIRYFDRKPSISFSGSNFSFGGCENNSTKVFVSGFDSTVTERDLELWFTKLCEDVKSVKLDKDHYGKSLGSCTVYFYNARGAEKVVHRANNREFNSRILSARSCKDTEDRSETLDKCVFVKGFGETLNDKDLEVCFEKYIGGVVKAEVAKFESGASKGYGKVQFYSHEDAVNAVLELNGVKVLGNILHVELYKSKEPNRNVYVKGFEDVFEDEDVRNIFGKYGEIESVKVERGVNGKSRGFGYVCFKRHQDAQIAIAKLDGKKLGSKVLTVCPHQPKEERQKEFKNRNLHVRNLHNSINENELKALFAPYGKILSVSVSSSPLKGINQGYVCFETSKEADDAVEALNLHAYKGLRLRVSPHQPKKGTNVEQTGLSNIALTNIPPGTSQIIPSYKSKQGEKTCKGRSKSMRNLNSINTKLQVCAGFGEGDKLLNHTRGEEPSPVKSSTKISANSDQSHKPPIRGGSGINHRRIAANFPYASNKSLGSSGKEICLPKSDSQPKSLAKSSENRDENGKRMATEVSSLQMTTAVPDCLEEIPKDLLQSILRSEENSAHSGENYNSSTPCHVQKLSVVIPKESMNSSQQPSKKNKKAYICGATVKKR